MSVFKFHRLTSVAGLLTLLLFPLALFAQEEIQNLNGTDWRFYSEKQQKWFGAVVPGNIYSDLFNNKLISDPKLLSNEKANHWVENSEWKYERVFQVTQAMFDKDHIELILDGVDTFADVYLNGLKVLSTHNMFRQWKVNVKGKLEVGENKLEVVLHPIQPEIEKIAKTIPFNLPNAQKTLVRKASFHFGIDDNSGIAPMGIWRGIRLKAWNGEIQTKEVFFEQASLSEKRADILAHFTIQSNESKDLTLLIEENGKPYTKEAVSIEKGKNEALVNIQIDNPKLWWCNGLGKPNLYHFTYKLLDKDKVLAEGKKTIGLRTVEWVEVKNKYQSQFYLKLNGKKVFAKGANYVPLSPFAGTTKDKQLSDYFKDIVESNFNMIRVWGGGIYEDDDFYSYCDENGILVWQDFMFSEGAFYPSREFVADAKEEITQNVLRLKQHPSIVAWCGNDAVQYSLESNNWDKTYKIPKAEYQKLVKMNKDFFDTTVKKWVKDADNTRTYFPTSVDWQKDYYNLKGKTQYFWWYWQNSWDLNIVRQKAGNFMLEYGMPSLATYNEARSDLLDKQNFAKNRNALISHRYRYIASKNLPPFDNFKDAVYLTQLLQVSLLDMAISAHRTREPFTMGSLYWYAKDPLNYPLSFSTIESNGAWKGAQYIVKKRFAPQTLIVKKADDDGIDVYVFNETLKSLTGSLTVEFWDTKGNKAYTEEKHFSLGVNESENVRHFPLWVVQRTGVKPSEMLVRVALKNAQGKEFVSRVFTPNLPNQIDCEKDAEVKIVNIGDNKFQLSCTKPALYVRLSSDKNLHFSDNYFTLLPIGKKIITVQRGEKVQLKDINIQFLNQFKK